MIRRPRAHPRSSAAMLRTLAVVLIAPLAAGQLVFEPPRALEAPESGTRVFVGLVDADERLDVVLASRTPGGPIAWLPGRGGGAFEPARAIDPGADGAVLEEVADLDVDGRVDLVLAIPGASGRGSVLVRFGDGQGGFGAGIPVNAEDAAAPVEVVAGDIDSVYHRDLAIVAAGDATHAPAIVIALGLGGRGFEPAFVAASIAAGSTYHLRIGDMTGDVLDDLLLVVDDDAQQYLTKGTGAIVPSPFPAPLGALDDVIVVDLEGNGRADVVTADGRIFFSKASGLLQPGQELGIADGRTLAATDLDQDGEPDLVVACGDGSLLTFVGVMGPEFATSNVVSNVSGIDGPGSLAFGDFDEDGRVDLIASRADAPAAWALRGRSYLPGEPFDDLGGALAGGGGFPILLASGSFGAGDAFALDLVAAPARAPVVFVAGARALNAPLLGGVLVPAPALLLGLATDAQGRASVAGVVREQVQDLQAFAQWWIVDRGAIQGWAATSAVAIAGGS